MKSIRIYLTQVLLLVMVLATAGVNLACPKKDAVRAAIDASYRLPATTNDLIAKIKEGRDRGIITIDQSKQFGEALAKVAAAEVVYVGMVKAMHNAIKAGAGQPSPETLRSLRDFFDVQIIGPFLNVLEVARVLSGDSVRLILVAITAVQILLRTIGGGIGSNLINALAGNVAGPANRSFANV